MIETTRTQNILNCYGKDRNTFLSNPKAMLTVQSIGGLEKCCTRLFPTFHELDTIYGRGTAREWTRDNLYKLNNYCSVHCSLNDSQLDELAENLTYLHPDVTMAQFTLFCHYVKNGKYFYGDMIPQKVCFYYTEFLQEVKKIQAEQEALAEQRKRREQDRSSHDRCVTRDEYNQIVLDAQMGDEKALRRLIPPDLPQSERKDFIHFILTYDPFKMGRR